MTASPTRIRELFLDPRPSYSPAEAAEAVGMAIEDVWGANALGELETDESGDIPWAELVSFAMDFWDQEEVEAALGDDLADVLPELLRLDELAVRIPRLEIAALERIAVRDGRSVDAVLARELRELVSSESAWLSAGIPGFAQALNWPE
ncbi:MAG: hypothetical protein JO093_07730 [Acidobacteria bacterium]|nr:hypothetical protein [Acidobacteriota bacterium]MBV9185495.1 hypothetical protein [Acidobacteriota bacterium]